MQTIEMKLSPVQGIQQTEFNMVMSISAGAGNDALKLQ